MTIDARFANMPPARAGSRVVTEEELPGVIGRAHTYTVTTFSVQIGDRLVQADRATDLIRFENFTIDEPVTSVPVGTVDSVRGRTFTLWRVRLHLDNARPRHVSHEEAFRREISRCLYPVLGILCGVAAIVTWFYAPTPWRGICTGAVGGFGGALLLCPPLGRYICNAIPPPCVNIWVCVRP